MMQLFVLGMHRSGTSGITRLLNMAGAYFGPEGMSNGADAGNPKGFWERLDVRAACDAVLKDAGFDWWKLSDFSIERIPDDVRARYVAELRRIVLELDAHRPWVVKEPRLCLLFPLVRPHLELPVCIHVAREPIEVADSLRTRNGIPGPVGLALWETYTLHGFRASVGLPRLLVHYEDLLRSPVETVTQLVGQLADLGVTGLRVPSEHEIAAFITPDLHRESRSTAERAAWMNEQQTTLAAAIDDGTVLEQALPDRSSESGREQLQVFEELVGVRDRATSLEMELGADTKRRRRAEDSLRRVERDVRVLSRARTWRLAWRVTALQRKVRGRSTGGQPLSKVLKGIERTRRELDRGDTDTDVPAAPTENAAARSATRAVGGGGGARRARSKVAVLAWDVGHNPLGRAYVLAGVLSRKFDVEIWGAQFERYGSHIWSPLEGCEIPIHSFPGRKFPEHRAVMMEIASKIDADAIYVSKPRLPSYGLGVLAKQARNRPLVLDVDDHELSFFDIESDLDPREVSLRDRDVALPFGETWTRVCQSLIPEADRLTVSNVALQERFGGTIVPHARDERIFDPGLHDREVTRRRIGVGEGDRLLLFGGTPREHKGIVEVLRALDRLGDDRYRVLLFGTRELEALRGRIGDLERWTIALPYQPFRDLPGLVGAADLACVLQDPDHRISRYQLPAKITDALAMAVPCLVRATPPVQSLIDDKALQVLGDDEELHTRIADIFDHYDDALDRAAHGRDLFTKTYSYEAVSEVVAPLFDEVLDAPPPLSSRLKVLTDVQRDLFGSQREDARPPVRVPGRRRRDIAPGEQYDIVMFWKQNDTGIYGRRQDMFVKYLARSGRVRSIVHFDKRTTPENLFNLYRRARGDTHQGRLVVRQTLGRLLRRLDTERVSYYTFLHAGKLSVHLHMQRRAQYPEYVKSVLACHGFGERPMILWAYPTNEDLPPLIDALDPDIVVTDVIDDHRTFAAEGTPGRESFERNYREVLARSDVVLANCEPVARGMSSFAPEIHVVPNALELRHGNRTTTRPRELKNIAAPIIGYVGNLSDRLDMPLLETLVREHPVWQFVFVGSAHHDQSVLRLESLPNVHFVGVKPYEEALHFIDHFDVAIIPHADNDVTRSMSPLKAFVYCSTGVPVVSTPVANLGELEGLITIARGPVEFGDAIEAALVAGRTAPDLDALAPHSWDARIEQTLEVIDRTVGATAPR